MGAQLEWRRFFCISLSIQFPRDQKEIGVLTEKGNGLFLAPLFFPVELPLSCERTFRVFSLSAGVKKKSGARMRLGKSMQNSGSIPEERERRSSKLNSFRLHSPQPPSEILSLSLFPRLRGEKKVFQLPTPPRLSWSHYLPQKSRGAPQKKLATKRGGVEKLGFAGA